MGSHYSSMTGCCGSNTMSIGEDPKFMGRLPNGRNFHEWTRMKKWERNTGEKFRPIKFNTTHRQLYEVFIYLDALHVVNDDGECWADFLKEKKFELKLTYVESDSGREVGYYTFIDQTGHSKERNGKPNWMKEYWPEFENVTTF